MNTLALTLAGASYGLLLWQLGTMVVRVMMPGLPDWIATQWREGLKTMVKTYWTVRYEEDDEGLWQVVEDRDGNRYRVHVRDSKGEMKW